MIRLLLRFSVSITLLLGVTFGIHLLVLNALSLPLFDNSITSAYLLNYLLAILIFGVLFQLKNKYAESWGYLFFMGSFLKFIAFFIFIYPSFKADNIISTLEFSSFFVPYAFALIFEVIYLVRILQNEG